MRGNIIFPGGRVDPQDETLIDTALREAHEEIDLPFDHVSICGFLPDMLTGTGYRVTPVVAQSTKTAAVLQELLCPNPQEVDEIFDGAASVLWMLRIMIALCVMIRISWRSWRLMYEGQTIWGATAAIFT